MAKRYIRINFQNTPSTATPLSAEILNKMDKGIDDLDNAIEDLYNKKIDKTSIGQTTEVSNPNIVASTVVTNGLQQSVNILSGNLANFKISANFLYDTPVAVVANTPLTISAITNKRFTDYNFIMVHLTYEGGRYSFLCLSASSMCFFIGTNKVVLSMTSPNTSLTITSTVAFTLQSIWGF